MFFPRKLVFIFIYIYVCACHTRFIPVSDLFFTETHLCVVNRRQWIINRLISSCATFLISIAELQEIYLSISPPFASFSLDSFSRSLARSLSLLSLGREGIIDRQSDMCAKKSNFLRETIVSLSCVGRFNVQFRKTPSSLPSPLSPFFHLVSRQTRALR